MKHRRFRLWVGMVICLGSSISLRAQELAIYDDALQNGFQDWSWAVRNLAEMGTVHSGQFSIAMEPDSWAGIYFHHGSGLHTWNFDTLVFWIHGGTSGGQNLSFNLQLGGITLGSVALADYLPGGPTAGTWTRVEIAFADLGFSGGPFDGVIFQDGSGGDQATVYFDDLALTPNPVSPPQISIDIGPESERRAIDPRIYGVNFGDPLGPEYPVRRWGGNATSRYNWQIDVSNRASDYFFLNIPNADPGTLPDGSRADVFLDETLAYGGEPLLTIPLIGWTPTDQDREERWGFSVALYGPQDQVECDLYDPIPDWCSDDAGNGHCEKVVNKTGFCVDGLIVGNAPADTSDPISSTFVSDWMAHIAGRVGTATQGGLRLFALDNEPMLWHDTHRDVEPNPLTYDEIWSRTVDIAAAIKTQDSEALIFGPAVWGWCAFFTSASDALFPNGSCVDGPDRQAHGGEPFIEWYLQQVCDHGVATGVRPVDYLDLHFYPQGDVSGTTSETAGEDLETSVRRLRSVKELYDPTHDSESWIGEPIYLVPRAKAWIQANCPGLGLAITEYKWGADDGPSGALAQAEVLAIFGREGVDLATRWVAPEPGSRTEDAFRLYLSYDGSGAQLTGESVLASSSDRDAIAAYAIRSSGPNLYVLLFNKDTIERHAEVTVAGGLSGMVDLYGFDATQGLGSLGTVASNSDRFSLTLAARSATLAIVSWNGGPIFADGFESGSTGAWSASVGGP